MFTSVTFPFDLVFNLTERVRERESEQEKERKKKIGDVTIYILLPEYKHSPKSR